MRQTKIISLALLILCLFSCSKQTAIKAIFTYNEKNVQITDKQILIALNDCFSENSSVRYVVVEAYDIEAESDIIIFYSDESSKTFDIFLSPNDAYYQNNDGKCYLMTKEATKILLEYLNRI